MRQPKLKRSASTCHPRGRKTGRSLLRAGASPGASIAPAAMLELLERCFGHKMVEWGDKIKEMVPSYGVKLSTNKKLFEQVWERTQRTLKLED